jgi:hypothetical protein
MLLKLEELLGEASGLIDVLDPMDEDEGLLDLYDSMYSGTIVIANMRRRMEREADPPPPAPTSAAMVVWSGGTVSLDVALTHENQHYAVMIVERCCNGSQLVLTKFRYPIPDHVADIGSIITHEQMFELAQVCLKHARSLPAV